MILDYKCLFCLVLMFNWNTIESAVPPPAGQIKNGEPAGQNDFPYMVALLGNESQPNLFGAGSLLADQWILTTKFASMDSRGHKYKIKELVVAPMYDPDLHSEKMRNGKKYTVEKYFCPASGKLDWTSSHGDIALLKLQEPIPLSDTIKPIEISRGSNKMTQQVLVAGWGYGGKNKAGENRLQFAKMTLFTPKCYITCKINIRSRFSNSAQVCNGDIGGPVVSRGEGGDKLVGLISSFDNLCLAMNIFVNATTFGAWVVETMSRDPPTSDCPA